MRTFDRSVIGILGVLALIVIVQSLMPREYVSQPREPVVEKPCTGQAIQVAFPYTGSINDPWTCKEQCDDNKPRYILYSNGKATQCETPPGCNDIGEDRGITCTPPGGNSAS